MYRVILSTFLFFAVSILQSFGLGKDGYSIQVKVSGIKEGMFQLANYYGDKQYLKDSCKIDEKGIIVFKGDEKLEGGIYMVITPEKKYFEIIIDKEQKFSLETDTTDFIKFMKIKGSEENTIFYEYLNFLNPRGKEASDLSEKMKGLDTTSKKAEIAVIKEKMQKIDNEVKDYKKLLQSKYPGSFVAMFLKAMDEIEIPEPPVLENGKIDSTFKFRYYKDHYWDNLDLSDERIVRTPIYHGKLNRYMENLTIPMPDSINATADIILEKVKKNSELFKYTLWWITNTYERSKIMGMDAVFVHMTDNYYKKGDAYWVDSLQLQKIIKRSDQLKPILIGKIAPDLKMKDGNMKEIPLHSVKAKHTILFIWDPDCGHCKKEAPKLLEVYKKLKSKGLEVYAVCSAVDLEKWQKFITENNLNWINVWDPYNTTNFRHIYDVYSTPIVYLLDENKEIIAKRIGVEQIEEIIEKEAELSEKRKK